MVVRPANHYTKAAVMIIIMMIIMIIIIIIIIIITILGVAQASKPLGTDWIVGVFDPRWGRGGDFFHSVSKLVLGMGGSPGELSERACDVGEAKEGLDNEL